MPEFPRPLTQAEQAVLERMLSVDFAGVQALRGQARQVVADGRCRCGCPSLDLRVLGDLPQATGVPEGPVPVDVVIHTSGGVSKDFILLFVHDGHLSYLEYVPLADPPAGWPAAEQLEIGPARDEADP